MNHTFIDTHAHLYLKAFREDLDNVIERADKAGITGIFLPNLDSSSVEDMFNVCLQHKICHPMIGLHPTSVKKDYKKELASLEQYLSDERIIAVGEIGMDLYWDRTFLNEQKDAFRQQLRWAKESGLPVVIHARESFNEIFEVLDAEADRSLRGVFHSFTGTSEDIEKILSYDFYIGINGIVTFKNAGLDQIAANIPSSRLLIETDAPFLAPVPYRGKRNESAYVTEVAAKMASIYDMELPELAEITTRNAFDLFPKASQL